MLWDVPKVFISHAGRDLAWAEWISWQLEQAGYEVELDAWDWAAGDNFVLRMSSALDSADAVVALYSTAYFEAGRFTAEEWSAVLARRERLVPVRVEEVRPAAVLAPLVHKDLFGLSEADARRALLSAVAGPVRPSGPPTFPPDSAGGPRLPGALPPVWNVPPRPVVFSGRDGLLVELRRRLGTADKVVVQAVHGVGGVGKTTLAIEYAYRLANTYDLVWWVDAEQAELVAGQLAELGAAAGWLEAGLAGDAALAAVRRQLARSRHWLVIFDNAEDSAALRHLLPPTTGHVLITSRSHMWTGVAAPLGVDVFTRSEAVALLSTVVPGVPSADASALAEALGDLPLAVTQAAGVLAETGMSVEAYRAEFDRGPVDVLDEGVPADYRGSLAKTVGVAVDRLAAVDPAAAQMLRVCAFLAAEPVPTEMFTAAREGVLPEPLAAVAGSAYAVGQVMGRICRFGLGKVGDSALVVHRLTQALVRESLGEVERAAVSAQALALVLAARPVDPDDPALWPRWARWMPHLPVLDAATSRDASVRHAADFAVWYLIRRGEFRAAAVLAEEMHAHAQRLFDDHDDMSRLIAARTLANVHGLLGRYEEALPLAEEAYERYRHKLGDDAPYTLNAAHSLSGWLRQVGQHDRARAMDEDTLGRRRRLLGDDDPLTLSAANSLAADLAELGEHEQARILDQDTFDRRRRILGDDHPDTLDSANNLAVNLTKLGDYEGGLSLDRDTLDRRRRVLGDDHPDTRDSVANLAFDLRALGRDDEAAALEAEFKPPTADPPR
jgi:tetratricopeptide (TPR) repeat protein